MDLGLRDKMALVTGSTAGIGLAIAEALLNEGARVIINGRDPNRVAAVVERLQRDTPGQAVGFAADVCDSAAVQSLVQHQPEIDILINNVGVYESKHYLEITDEDWLRLYQINVLSGVRLARLVLPSMMRRDWGRIIFIASESGLNIPPDMVHYGMTKTAQLAVSRGLAEVVAGTNITVNAVLPGPTWSRGVSRLFSEEERGGPDPARETEFFRVTRPSSLIGRFSTPAEVASLVAYVASPRASATTGAALRADGGVVRGVF